MKQQVGFTYLESVPLESRSVLALAKEARLDAASQAVLLENGLSRIQVLGDNDLAVLVRSALQKLEAAQKFAAPFRAVFFLHTLPGLGLGSPTFFRDCVKGTTLENVPLFPISGQPCVIFHYGVMLALRWLELLDVGEEPGSIVLVGADAAPTARDRFFFGTAMADSILTGVIGSSSIRHTILGNLSETYVIACQGEDSPPEKITRFRAGNPTWIRDAIQRVLYMNDLDLDQVDWIVPHSPYLRIASIIGEMLNIPNSKFLLEYLPDTGHMNSNDSFCHYIRAHAEGKISPGQIALLINPGFGGSRGLTILQPNRIHHV